MSNFTNRQALYNAYCGTDDLAWASIMGTLATEGTDVPSKLYYLSLDPSLDGNYVLQENFDDIFAKAADAHYQEQFTITLPHRLLTSPTIQGCWNQVYRRVKHCFAYETDLAKPIDIYLYEVDVTDCVVIDDVALTTNWLVHDAYMSQSHAVFGHPVLKQVQKLTIKNTLNYPDEYCTYYNPFNDGSYMQCLLSTPLEILDTQVISTNC